MSTNSGGEEATADRAPLSDRLSPADIDSVLIYGPAMSGKQRLAYDILTDHRGVADGHWTYVDDIPGPRHLGVPWWNYVGWFVVSCTTAALALPFL